MRLKIDPFLLKDQLCTNTGMENLTEVIKAVEKCEIKMDIPGSLPIEIFHQVLLHLSPRDLHNTWKCCRKWRDRMESFWKGKCMREHYFECEDDLNSKFYRNFVKSFSHWQGIYMYNSLLRENWMNMRYKEVVIENGEQVTSIFSLSGDVIIATTSSNEIWVVNSTTGVVENRFNLEFHYQTYVNIRAVKKIDNRLLAILEKSNFDENDRLKVPRVMILKVWNIETGEILIVSEKEAHDSVQRVNIHEDLITLLTHPYAVYIYNINKEDLVYEQSCVTTVCHYNDKIVTGNHMGTILMMDLDFTELMTLKCCTNERTITDIQMGGNYLVCVCKSRIQQEHIRACIWNIETKTKLYEVQEVINNDFLRIFVNENKLFYLSKYLDEPSTFKMCRLDTGECLLELEYGLVGTNDFLLIKCDIQNLRLLKMWSIKTGELVADLELPSPFISAFFNECIRHMKTKSKFVIYYYDRSIHPYQRKEHILKVFDFEAQIEI